MTIHGAPVQNQFAKGKEEYIHVQLIFSTYEQIMATPTSTYSPSTHYKISENF